LSSPSTLTLSSLFLSPPSFNWRTYDRVTDVRNQRSCGSCWAFAATAQYESLLAIATNGTKYNLSEQYLLQCDTNSYGCSGGYTVTSLMLANSTGIPL
jgi:C1A family cysteine protease